jgi:hypothetical protein
MIRIGPAPASCMNDRAVASGSTDCTRSSVDRSTREIREVTMIVTMNQEAIFTPSGRSITLRIVV